MQGYSQQRAKARATAGPGSAPYTAARARRAGGRAASGLGAWLGSRLASRYGDGIQQRRIDSPAIRWVHQARPMPQYSEPAGRPPRLDG
jgi:hypothetical protein